MELLPRREKSGNERGLIIASLIGVLIALLVCSAWRWEHVIAERALKIHNAPINPDTASSFAFVSLTPEKEELVDSVLNVRCYGHQLTRQVSQYVQIQQDMPPSPILVIQDQPVSAGQFPLSSKLFEDPILHQGPYSVEKSLVPPNIPQPQSFLLEILSPRPAAWKHVTAQEFFWGANPHHPEAGNISVNYTCTVVPEISVWGSVDEHGVITPDRWYGGISKLPAEEQKARLIYATDMFRLSSLAIHGFLINAIVLIGCKERFLSGHWHKAGKFLLSLRKYDVLLSPLLLLITPSFLSAMSVCTLLVSYAACCLFAQNQQQRWLEIQRIHLYG